MKICGQCGQTFSDRIDFCFYDGEVLTLQESPGVDESAIDAPMPRAVAPGPATPGPVRRRRSLLGLRSPIPGVPAVAAEDAPPVPSAFDAPPVPGQARPDAPPAVPPRRDLTPTPLEPLDVPSPPDLDELRNLFKDPVYGAPAVPPPTEATEPPATEPPATEPVPDVSSSTHVPDEPTPPPALPVKPTPEPLDIMPTPAPPPRREQSSGSGRPGWLIPAVLAGGAGLMLLVGLGAVGLGLTGFAVSSGSDDPDPDPITQSDPEPVPTPPDTPDPTPASSDGGTVTPDGTPGTPGGDGPADTNLPDDSTLGDGTDAPGDSTDTPEVTPGDGTDTPGDVTVPGTPDTTDPKPRTDTPGDGTDTPGDGTDTPGDGTDTPGDGTDTPGDGTDTPSNTDAGSPWGNLSSDDPGTADPVLTRVSISSSPAGATVRLNGSERGVTPLDIEIDPGTYSVELLLDGHTRVVKTLDVSGPTTTLDVPLASEAAASGYVMVVFSGHDGDALIIDGQPKGPLPVGAELTAGPHTFAVEGPSGTFTVNRDVVLGDGATVINLTE